MKHTSLDTNVLLRWLLGDIKEQTKIATRIISSGKSFYISDMAISEVVFVLERVVKADRKVIADNIYKILAQENFNCNRLLIKPATELYIQHLNLSFVDCRLAVQADLNNATPLYTFDKKLAAQLEPVKLLK